VVSAGIDDARNMSLRGCAACAYSNLLPSHGLLPDDGCCGTVPLRCPGVAHVVPNARRWWDFRPLRSLKGGRRPMERFGTTAVIPLLQEAAGYADHRGHDRPRRRGWLSAGRRPRGSEEPLRHGANARSLRPFLFLYRLPNSDRGGTRSPVPILNLQRRRRCSSDCHSS